jgi:hypothetical protein
MGPKCLVRWRTEIISSGEAASVLVLGKAFLRPRSATASRQADISCAGIAARRSRLQLKTV